MVIGKMTQTCARNSKRSATSTELDNKCPDQLSLLVKKTAVCRITQIPQAESFEVPLRKITSFSTASAQLSKLRRSFVKASGIGTCVFSCRNAAFTQS